MALGIWLQTGMYVLDLLNEVLNIDFGQEAAKISQVKVGGKKDICRTAQLEPECPGSTEMADIFFTANFDL